MRFDGLMAVPLACALLALVACGSRSANETASGDETSGAAEQALVPPDQAAATPAAGAHTVPVSDASAPSGEPAAAIQSPAARQGAAGGAGSGDLTAYVGKWPFDEVNGVKWNDHPLVKTGIEKTVSDAAARKAILSLPGPASMIALYQGKVASWACEAHNCGDHQWTVMLDPKTAAADVCYHNEAKTPGQSRWFLATGKVDTRAGNCSVE